MVVGDPGLEIDVQLFAAVREAVGRDRVSVRLRRGASVEDLLERLGRDHPAIAAMRATLAVAVNHEIARGPRSLAPGDEVALIPPVGGG